jgi:DeoR/GlpR family transcriptional regulator of sugar metabolism
VPVKRPAQLKPCGGTSPSRCARVVAVVDHTKLGQVGLATFAPLTSLGCVITNAEADHGVVAELRAAGVDIQLV